MAITATDDQPARQGFIVNGNSADASGCEALKAAPGAGVSHYLEHVTVSSGAAITVTIGSGESSGAVETVLIGPLHIAANSQVVIPLLRVIKLTANKSLTVDASGAGDVTVLAQGYTE